MTVPRRILAGGAVVLLCLAALGAGMVVHMALPGLAPPAAVAAAVTANPMPQAVAQTFTNQGVLCGKVMIGPREVITCFVPSGELQPGERASLAAARINLALQQGAAADDFRAMGQADQWLVAAKSQVIISVAPNEPETLQLTAQAVAERWATNITLALHEALGTTPTKPTALAPIITDAGKLTVNGAEVGVVLVGNVEVLRLTSGAAGLGPFDRAKIIADRLKAAVTAGALPQDIRAAEVYGMAVVQIRETLLVTADADEAQRAGMTPPQLAQQWAGKLGDAVAAYYASGGQLAQAAPGDWIPPEPYDDKWVPIISVLEGTKVGLARVTGPRSSVTLVQAVAQLETHWKRALTVSIYIPISPKVPGKTLDRVKGCGVSGLADIKL